MEGMLEYSYKRATVGDIQEYFSTAPMGPYAKYYEAELRVIAERQPTQPVAARHFVERHAHDALLLRKLIFAELKKPKLKPELRRACCLALPDLNMYGGGQMTNGEFMRRYHKVGSDACRTIIKDMCEKHAGELIYVWDGLCECNSMPEYDDMSNLPYWHPQLLTNDGHRQDLAQAWDEYMRASRRGKGGAASRDFFEIAVGTPSSIWAVGLDRRLDRHRCACGIVETRFFSLEALIWEFCGWYSLKDIYTFFASSPSSA